MIRTFCKLVLGLTLTGCVVNNVHHTSYSAAYKFDHRETTVVELEREPVAVPVPAVAAPHPTVVGNTHIRPECGPYVPLSVPEPVKVDLTKLQAAASSQEINAIVLQNVKDLRQQMQTYAANSQKHYAEYVHRCVVR
jgi:hypothetical protein